jgi:hypothetical protein
MAKVTPAADRPSTSCRSPVRHTDRPVRMVIAAPMPNSASALMATPTPSALQPLMNTNGNTGTTAPTAKSTNDVPAAVQGKPPSSAGSMQSSSRVRTSSAARGQRDRALELGYFLIREIPRCVRGHEFDLSAGREICRLVEDEPAISQTRPSGCRQISRTMRVFRLRPASHPHGATTSPRPFRSEALPHTARRQGASGADSLSGTIFGLVVVAGLARHERRDGRRLAVDGGAGR